MTVEVTPNKCNLTARVPFCNHLAREFGYSRAHVWRLCAGQTDSPKRYAIIKRQAELIRQSENREPAESQQLPYNIAAQPISKP